MPEMYISKDAAVRALCHDLYKMREGLAAMGIHAYILDHARDKLKELAGEVERFKASETYAIGYGDGWNAAMATGIPGQEADNA
jgi:hypothetical protein